MTTVLTAIGGARRSAPALLLGLFHRARHVPHRLPFAHIRRIAGFTEILRAFARDVRAPDRIEAIAVGVAGPVVDQRARLTNVARAPPSFRAPIMSSQTRNTLDDLIQRVYGEFLEMPGLRLTCRQAQRLFGLDEHTCRQVLDALVEAKFLYRPAPGIYSRLMDGGEKPARLQMAKAARRGDG